MRDRLSQFGDTEVVVVTFTRQRNLAGYRRRYVDPLTVVTDENRVLYRAFDFGRGRLWRVWGWRTIRRYMQLFRSGDANVNRHFSIDGDTLQLGGDVVIGRDGRIAWIYRGAGPDDRPTIDELIEQVTRFG